MILRYRINFKATTMARARQGKPSGMPSRRSRPKLMKICKFSGFPKIFDFRYHSCCCQSKMQDKQLKNSNQTIYISQCLPKPCITQHSHAVQSPSREYSMELTLISKQ